MLRVEVFAVVQPTEERERVEQALRALFPDAEVVFEKGRLRATTDSLTAFLKKVRSQAIADATRAVLVRGLDEAQMETSFDLSKQAAFVGKVNFAEVAHPLGDLHVVVRSETLMRHIDDIAPEPERGDRTAQRRRAKTADEKQLKEHYVDYVEADLPVGEEEVDEAEFQGLPELDEPAPVRTPVLVEEEGVEEAGGEGRGERAGEDGGAESPAAPRKRRRRGA